MGVKYRSEVGEISASANDADTYKTRKVFTSSRPVLSTEDEREALHRRSKQYMVKGRIDGGRMMWDVFLLEGDSSPRLQASNFAFQAEAITFARDKSLGRLAVSFSGLRGMFRASSSGLAIPSRSIEKPGSSVVKIKPGKNGTVIVG